MKDLYGKDGVIVKNLKELTKKPVDKPQSKYTESFVPIKSITNGMIVLDDNVKVTGLKIQLLILLHIYH